MEGRGTAPPLTAVQVACPRPAVIGRFHLI